MLPIGDVNPSPLNPRKSFTEAQIADLADSIRELGIQQPIVVRASGRAMFDGRQMYEIIMGERRYRAAKSIGLESVPAIIRDGIDDAKLLELAIHENIKRADLNPIEEARAFQQLGEIGGLKQSEIGEKVGYERAAVSKRIGLLRLPADVQDMIATGKLSASHGVALLRFADFPELLSALAEAAAAQRLSTRDLEGDFASLVTHAAPNRDGQKVEQLGYNTPFDYKAICEKSCPFKAYQHSKYGYGYCLKPSHYRELVREAKAAEKRAMQETLAKAKAAAEKTGKDGKPDNKGLPKLADLGYCNYTDLSYNRAPGCSPACECSAVALDRQGNRVNVCLKPRHHESLKQAACPRKGAPDMPLGPGKYDDFATYVRDKADAEGVIVVVLGGRLGNGFSVQADLLTTFRLPKLLRNMADQIEESTREGTL